MEHPVDLPSVRLQESNAESTTQTMTCAEEPKSCDQHMHEDSEHIDAEIENSEVLDNGSLQYGMTSMLIKRRGIRSLTMRSNRLYAPFVALSKRFSKCAPTVVCAWPNTFAGHASFLMMIYPRDSFTVMAVVSAD